MNDLEVTYGPPRLLAIIELAYLREAMVAALSVLGKKRNELAEDREALGNLNATDQAMRRAFFISSFAILEQNMDEVVSLAGERLGKLLKPSDLRDGGVRRSLAFAEKVLGAPIGTSQSPWRDLLALQELRNHLIHYGSGFGPSDEHRKRRQRFMRIGGISFRPMICFDDHAIDEYLELFVRCIDELARSVPRLLPEEPPK